MTGSVPREARGVEGEIRARGSLGQKLLETHIQSWDTREQRCRGAGMQEPGQL